MTTNARRVRKAGTLIAAVALIGLAAKFLLLYLTDIVFAPPIVAVAAWLGPVPSFMIFVPVYAVASYWLAMLAVRGIDHRADGWLVRRLTSLVASERRDDTGRAIQRWWSRGPLMRGFGFLVSGILLGGILTTGMWRFRRPRAPLAEMRRVALFTSATFGVSFVALYAFVGAEAVRAATDWL